MYGFVVFDNGLSLHVLNRFSPIAWVPMLLMLPKLSANALKLNMMSTLLIRILDFKWVLGFYIIKTLSHQDKIQFHNSFSTEF